MPRLYVAWIIAECEFSGKRFESDWAENLG